MSTYKLTYFPLEAKAELIRYVFAQADVKFEDKRIKSEEWATMKPTTPFGYLPTLEVDGELLAGSGPIVRFLGERLGLAGSNDIENAKIAAIKDVLDEIVTKMGEAFFEEDEAAKAKLKDEMVGELIPKYLGLMEKTIKTNPKSGGFLFGLGLTYVDLNLSLVIDCMKLFKEEVFEGFPEVRKNYEAVRNQPRIAEWIKNRPERTFGTPIY